MDVSKSVSSTGTAATVTFTLDRAGIQWIIFQIATETLPARAGATAILRKNGRFVSSTAQASNSSAQGPPYLMLNSNDVVTLDFTGVQTGDTVIGTLFYNEQLWSNNPGPAVV